MQVVAHCPKCDAGLPVNAAEAPDVDQMRTAAARWCRSRSVMRFGATRAVDACPVCGGADLYIRKDFDPKVGLTVVIIGALISAVFYWFGEDLIAYSILGGAALIDLIVYGRLGDVTVCYRCHSEFRGKYRAHRLPFRSPHGRRARAGVRAEDRPPLTARVLQGTKRRVNHVESKTKSKARLKKSRARPSRRPVI